MVGLITYLFSTDVRGLEDQVFILVVESRIRTVHPFRGERKILTVKWNLNRENRASTTTRNLTIIIANLTRVLFVVQYRVHGYHDRAGRINTILPPFTFDEPNLGAVVHDRSSVGGRGEVCIRHGRVDRGVGREGRTLGRAHARGIGFGIGQLHSVRAGPGAVGHLDGRDHVLVRSAFAAAIGLGTSGARLATGRSRGFVGRARVAASAEAGEQAGEEKSDEEGVDELIHGNLLICCPLGCCWRVTAPNVYTPAYILNLSQFFASVKQNFPHLKQKKPQQSDF